MIEITRTSHRVVAAAAVVMAAFAAASPADAGRTPRANFGMDFAARRPVSATAIHLTILYKGRDPNAKPSPIRKIVLNAPRGTRFHTAALPRCGASDQQLLAEGDAACPRASRLGSGTLTAMTGFPGPAGTVVTKVTVFNTATGNVEVVKEASTGKPVATDRFRIRGRTWIAHPPDTPGGPPDGKTAVRRIDFTYAPKARWAVTPPKCPSRGYWRSTAAFTYADGVTAHVSDRTPCKQPAHGTVRRR